MKLDLHRKWRRNGYTIGRLYVDGQYICNTLEDTDRGLMSTMSEELIKSKKVYGETAIPTGTYPVTITYSNHFKKNMPLLNNVKGFEGVRIHSGSTPEHTSGCVLVGQNTEVGKLTSSRAWYAVVLEHIKQGLENGGKVEITIHW